MFEKIKVLMKNPRYVINYIKTNGKFNNLSTREVIELKYKRKMGYKLNLSNPITFNEKLQWLKLNWKDERATICADKYLVRDFVAQRIGSEYLSKLIAVYDSVEEIDFDYLPEQFVLKGTHGSGFNIICREKSNVNWNEKKIEMNRWLNTNYYWNNREPVYKDIQPRIIAEELLHQKDSDELRDYRFFCFHGEPKFIAVDFSITDKSKTRRNIYNLDWNLLDVEISYPRELQVNLQKPEKLDEMIELSRKLAEGFPHARVDFYYIDDKIIFGEITFFHQNGMAEIKPSKFDEAMGSWINLPIEKD